MCSALAYDPVQSLLAVGTSESLYGGGQIYIFGHQRTQCRLSLPRRATVRFLQFSAHRLVSIDSKNDLVVWDLETARKICQHAIPGIVTALVTDPMLDWAFVGLQNGEIVVYDLDREKLAPLRLPNFWREKYAKTRITPVVSLQLHPRDVGQLLIGYTEGLVIYSFKQNLALKFFDYEVPPGARGGNGDPMTLKQAHRPNLIQATWHPTGTFIAGVYDDNSLVFFDPKDGRIVMARSITETHVDRPASSTSHPPVLTDAITKLIWCCKENPDDTALLIVGGNDVQSPTKDLTFIELGPTPVYATSSWQVLSVHFEGKRQLKLPVPPGPDVASVCLLPRASPHFAGAQDPIAIMAILRSGELITMSFPTGHPISPTNQLPPSISFIHPFVTCTSFSLVERGRWLGMTEHRQQGPKLLQGGAQGTKPLRRSEFRNIIQTAHADGTVRIWDTGHGDEIENSAALQVDIARALDRTCNVEVSKLSMAGATGELAVGTRAGEVLVFRWGGNKTFGREGMPVQSRPGSITDISTRTEPSLKEGLQPFILYEMAQSPVSALKMSDVGFLGVGGHDGTIAIVDLRGPAVIFRAMVGDFAKTSRHGSLIGKRGSTVSAKPEWPVSIEFAVMTLDDDKYSSIACFVGTNLGKVQTFKILPQGAGGYQAQFAGMLEAGDGIISVNPIRVDDGASAVATGASIAALRNGQQTHGTLVIGKWHSSHLASLTGRSHANGDPSLQAVVTEAGSKDL